MTTKPKKAKADAPKADKPLQRPATFYLADLCKELGKDDKNVRAKFRKLYEKDDADQLPTVVSDKRWEFNEVDRDRVTELIVGTSTVKTDAA